MDNIFERVNENNSYWIGFIAADGYITQNGKSKLLGIGLNERDIDHLYGFRSFVDSNNKITKNKKNRSVTFRITNEKICSDLIKLGINMRKSTKDISLIGSIPDKYKNNFIAGLFDGDGSIFRYKKKNFYKDKVYKYEHVRVTLDSNEKTIDDIMKFLKNDYDFRILKKEIHGSIFRLTWQSKHDIKQFMSLYDKSDIKLKRKEKEMKECRKVLKNIKGRRRVGI